MNHQKRYDRRIFLRTGAKAAAVAAFLNPFQLFAAPSSAVLPAWTELIEYARWCPNVHNLQPHRIKIISENEAALYYDPTRLLPHGDPDSIFVTVAMGIFIEHLAIAASPYGFTIEIVKVYEPITVEAVSTTLFARLKLIPAINKEPLNRRLIMLRRTSRLPYNERPLKTETLDKIKTEATASGFDCGSSSDKELIDFILKLNQETLFEDLGSDLNRTELDQLFRYSQKEALNKKDGLWSRCMCFPGALMRLVFHHPESWLKGSRKKILGDYYLNSFKGTATICWFSGKFNDTGEWLSAGRMLARTWLLTTSDQAFIHPFGSLITNAAAHQKITEKFKKSAKGDTIWMVFRAGYSKEPARSYRLRTDEIIIS